jgi:hypothetical protein
MYATVSRSHFPMSATARAAPGRQFSGTARATKAARTIRGGFDVSSPCFIGVAWRSPAGNLNSRGDDSRSVLGFSAGQPHFTLGVPGRLNAWRPFRSIRGSALAGRTAST